jgi:hypothetical protein
VTTPPRPDQETDPPAMVVSPGGAAGIFKGRLVVVFGPGFSGVFVYSPSPGPGKLVASIAAAGGTDPYGNTYPAGISTTDGTTQAILSGRELGWQKPSDAADNLPALFATPSHASGNSLTITSGEGNSGGGTVDASIAFYDSNAAAGNGLPVPSGTAAAFVATTCWLVTDSWHTVTVNANSWTGSFRYKFLPVGAVAVIYDLNPGTTADNTAINSSAIPSAYRPSGSGLQHIAGWQNGGGTSCSIRVGTTGVFFAYGASGTATNFRGVGLYYLDSPI